MLHSSEIEQVQSQYSSHANKDVITNVNLVEYLSAASPDADIRQGCEELGKKKSLEVETYLILDQELDTLNGSSGSLGNGGRDTTHCYRKSACDIICRPSSATINRSIFIDIDGDNQSAI